MALGDLYLVTIYGSLRGQQIINTFTYEHTVTASSGNGAGPLSMAFDLQFFTSGSGLRSAQFYSLLTWNEMRVINLFDPTDYAQQVYSPPIAGTGTTEGMPNFVAYGFRTGWLGGNVRRGFKRFAGVLETNVDNGVLTSAAQTALADLSDALGEYIEQGSEGFEPRIVKRVKVVDPVTGAISYRLPESTGEATAVPTGTWQLLTLATTQNTRKIGRGA